MLVDPLGGLLDGVVDGLLVLVRDLATETLLITKLGLDAVDEG
jgi:hypothetical protein